MKISNRNIYNGTKHLAWKPFHVLKLRKSRINKFFV